MLRIYLPQIGIADQFALICFLGLIILWFAWVLIQDSMWADLLHLSHFEDWLWRKHGVTVPTMFLLLLTMIGILYGVWWMLGQL